MKKVFMLTFLMLSVALGLSAQADKIVGTYKAIQNGNVSKVKIFKHAGGYRAQVFWLEQPNNPDGTPKTDHKNPDKAKQKTLATQIVLVDKVVYKDGVWTDGNIYDPTKGKTFNVTMSFESPKVLKVKGNWGPFSQTVKWTKLQ